MFVCLLYMYSYTFEDTPMAVETLVFRGEILQVSTESEGMTKLKILFGFGIKIKVRLEWGQELTSDIYIYIYL